MSIDKIENIMWQVGRPDENCFCFINLGDHIELAWYSEISFGGCWFKHAEQSHTFEDFIEDEDIKCWVKAEKIVQFLQEQKCTYTKRIQNGKGRTDPRLKTKDTRQKEGNTAPNVSEWER